MKQYKLLKDLPGIKSGTIPDTVAGAYYTFMGNEIRLGFSENFIIANPDWFELVEPKEFTEMQVRRALVEYAPFVGAGVKEKLYTPVKDGIIKKLREENL